MQRVNRALIALCGGCQSAARAWLRPQPLPSEKRTRFVRGVWVGVRAPSALQDICKSEDTCSVGPRAHIR